MAGALASTPRWVPGPARSAATREALRYPVWSPQDPEVEPLRDVSHLARDDQGHLFAVGRGGDAWSLASAPDCCRRDVAWRMRPGGLTRLAHAVAPRTMIEGIDPRESFPSAELCRLTEERTVVCAPRAYDGRLLRALRARPIATRARFTQASARPAYACGVTTGAEVRCWGPAVRAIPGLRGVRAVSVRDDGVEAWNHTAAACALRDAGDVWCWTSEAEAPRRVEALPPAVEVSGNRGVSCARTARGEVFCWGVVGRAWPGHPRTYRARRALDVRLPAPARALRPEGSAAMCAALTTGEVTCWGGESTAWRHDRPTAALGDDEEPVRYPPDASPARPSRLPDGRVLYYALTSGERTPHERGDVPRARAFIRRATDRSGDDTENACALAVDGQIWCWGDNQQGQLGLDDAPRDDRPVPVHVLREE